MTTQDVIIGVGSPHGDDQIGWRVVDHLAKDSSVQACLRKVSDPVDLLAHLQAVERLVVIDACRTGRPPGTLIRWDSLDAGISGGRWPSTHRFSLSDTLQLARALDRLPPRVILYGVEVGSCEPQTDLCPEVAGVLPELARHILAEGTACGIVRDAWKHDSRFTA